MVYLSKISGKNYISTFDIDTYIREYDDEVNINNKVFNYIIAEWLSVIIFNKK